MSLLEINGLGVSYSGKRVLDDVSFNLDSGEAIGIVGESGSGKTQTALAILGLLPGYAKVQGSIVFDGRELVGADDDALDRVRARRIAMIFQDPTLALNPYLRIGEQLRRVLIAHGVATGKAADERVIEMLGRVGLPDPDRQFRAWPHRLSGGMRQRVMIASALLAEPDVLIADEPTTALDVTVQAQILELLDELREEMSLLMITHDLGIVAGFCERTLVLENGSLVEQGSTLSVFSAPAHDHTRNLLRSALRIDSPDVPGNVDTRPVLSADAIDVSYELPGRREIHVVHDVELTVREGETLAIVGESGSGKTTLVRAMLGLVPMRAGEFVFDGERRDLQLVFQDPVGSLNPQMRVGNIVAEPLHVHAIDMGRREIRERVIEILEQVGLGKEFLQRYPHELSGGQAQRVAIARALVLKPKVLVCDEAVAALDGSVRRQILELLGRLQAETGLSLIFISHDLAVVRSISHRIIVMYLGRIVEMADNETLFREPRHPYTQALLDAVPIPDPKTARLPKALRGEIPSPYAPPPGCVFNPRCRHRIDECSMAIPPTRVVGRSRVACVRATDQGWEAASGRR